MKEHEFKKKHSFAQRVRMTIRIRDKYPDRIPVIVEPYSMNNDGLPILDKTKFLVPNDVTLDQFKAIIYNRLKISDSDAIFLFCNNKLLSCGNHRFHYLYSFHKDEDGFLYFYYSKENTYG